METAVGRHYGVKKSLQRVSCFPNEASAGLHLLRSLKRPILLIPVMFCLEIYTTSSRSNIISLWPRRAALNTAMLWSTPEV